MKEDTRIAVIELHLLKETIREVIREELGKQAVPSSEELTYKETERLSISQVAKYLGVSTKTVSNYKKEHKIMKLNVKFIAPLILKLAGSKNFR